MTELPTKNNERYDYFLTDISVYLLNKLLNYVNLNSSPVREEPDREKIVKLKQCFIKKKKKL